MNNDNKFPEQQAPEKNTDNEFVKVGEDGAPQILDDNKNADSKKEDHTTTLDKR